MKPYKCSRCDKAFTQRCSLESHLKKVHGLDYSYDYKERRTKVYVCEECGHSTGDPEEHFRHLQQNHPFCPALARCHDKRQFKFQTPDNVQDFQKVDPKPEATESLVRTTQEQIVNVKSSEVITQNHTNTADRQEIKIQTIIETPQMQHNIVRSENDLNKELPSLSSNSTESKYEQELSVAVQSVQEQCNHMEEVPNVGIATRVTAETMGNIPERNRLSLMNKNNLMRSDVSFMERTKINLNNSPRHFPWKSPRKSPRKLGQSPQKLRNNRSPLKSGQTRSSPFRIYEDVPQYDVENRSIQKLRQYGGDDYYKSKQSGPLAVRSHENENTHGTTGSKQFGSQENRILSVKQPLGSLTQNTQHLQ